MVVAKIPLAVLSREVLMYVVNNAAFNNSDKVNATESVRWSASSNIIK